MVNYFSDANSKAPYLLAETYINFIIKKCYTNGYINTPDEYVNVQNDRLINAINANNDKSIVAIGYKVYRDNKIYISNPNSLNMYEKYAILITHCSNVTFNSFAAEVQVHADMIREFGNTTEAIKGIMVGINVQWSQIWVSEKIKKAELLMVSIII